MGPKWRVWAWRQPGEERGLTLAVAVGGADSPRLPTCPSSEHFLSGAWVPSERPLPRSGHQIRGQVGGLAGVLGITPSLGAEHWAVPQEGGAECPWEGRQPWQKLPSRD